MRSLILGIALSLLALSSAFASPGDETPDRHATIDHDYDPARAVGMTFSQFKANLNPTYLAIIENDPMFTRGDVVEKPAFLIENDSIVVFTACAQEGCDQGKAIVALRNDGNLFVGAVVKHDDGRKKASIIWYSDDTILCRDISTMAGGYTEIDPDFVFPECG